MTTMRIPMLIATGMAVVLMAANAPQASIHGQFAKTSTAGPRAGNSECAPSDVNPNDARYTCPQKRSAEQLPQQQNN
jgi:hypothetical protein